MIVVCYGMAKSASTFATQIVLGLIEEHCRENSGNIIDLRHFLPNNNLNDLFVDACESIDAIAELAIKEFGDSVDDFLVMKTHSPCEPFIKSLIENNNAVAIATFRHPIDIALSLCDAAKIDIANGRFRFNNYRTIDDTISSIDWEIDCFKSWAIVSGVQLAYFDDLALKPLIFGERVANKLAIKCEPKVVLKILENKKDLIWEFNKGKINRRFDEINTHELDKLNNYWYDFAEFVRVECGVQFVER
jgi:hypothetical protein